MSDSMPPSARARLRAASGGQGAVPGLGLAAIGRPGYITLGRAEDLGPDRDRAVLQGRAHALLDAAWAEGVRAFDTARSYGEGEAFLGRWLAERGHAPAETFVSSKWGYTYTADWQVESEVHETKDHGRAVLDRQWPWTRGHLGGHLDLYQVHSATLISGILEDGDVHRRLAELRAETGTRLGLSLSGPNQAATLERALGLTVDGEPLFSAVQATWNLLEPSCGPALRAAHAQGWLVVIKEGVANGRLTARGLSTLEAARPLTDEARRLAVGVDAVALAAIRAQPWVDVVLSGAVTPDQLHSNLQAWAVDVAPEALATLALPPERYWSERGALPWG